jgi:hypothetical protein
MTNPSAVAPWPPLILLEADRVKCPDCKAYNVEKARSIVVLSMKYICVGRAYSYRVQPPFHMQLIQHAIMQALKTERAECDRSDSRVQHKTLCAEGTTGENPPWH